MDFFSFEGNKNGIRCVLASIQGTVFWDFQRCFLAEIQKNWQALLSSIFSEGCIFRLNGPTCTF
jgi:hypothetical protein